MSTFEFPVCEVIELTKCDIITSSCTPVTSCTGETSDDEL